MCYKQSTANQWLNHQNLLKETSIPQEWKNNWAAPKMFTTTLLQNQNASADHSTGTNSTTTFNISIVTITHQSRPSQRRSPTVEPTKISFAAKPVSIQHLKKASLQSLTGPKLPNKLFKRTATILLTTSYPKDTLAPGSETTSFQHHYQHQRAIQNQLFKQLHILNRLQQLYQHSCLTNTNLTAIQPHNSSYFLILALLIITATYLLLRRNTTAKIPITIKERPTYKNRLSNNPKIGRNSNLNLNNNKSKNIFQGQQNKRSINNK
jgi:hypothetical protein